MASMRAGTFTTMSHQDVTSLSSLLFYLAQIRLARILRRRVMIYAQGIGPLRRPAARRLTARTLWGVDCITVRDAESAARIIAPSIPCHWPLAAALAFTKWCRSSARAAWVRCTERLTRA